MAAPTLQVSVPVNIQQFFEQVPEVKEEKGNKTYSVPGLDYKIFVNKFSGFNLIYSDLNFDQNKMQDKITTLYKTIVANNESCSFEVNLPENTPTEVLAKLLPQDVFSLKDMRNDRQSGQIKFAKWLSEGECMIPPGGTTDIGATGLLVDKVSQEVLLVVPKFRNQWEGAGGTARAQEVNRHAAVREILEETGLVFTILSDKQPSDDVAAEIKIAAFNKLAIEPLEVGNSYFPYNQLAHAYNFGFVFFAQLHSQKLEVVYNKETYTVEFRGKETKPQVSEVRRAEWIPVNTVLNEDTYDGIEFSKELRSYLSTAMQSHGHTVVKNEGWRVITSGMIQPANAV